MQKQGYRPSTTQSCIKTLKAIARRTNLLNPERVKTYLGTAQISESRKSKATEDLARFYAHNHIPFDKPNYKRVEKLPFIPLETEVDQLLEKLKRNYPRETPN